MKRIAMLVSVAVVAVVLAGTCLAAAETITATSPISAAPATASAPAPANGLAALEQATKDKKYLFIFFFKNPQEEATQAMRLVFDATLAKVADKAETYYVNLTNSSENGIVAKYDAGRAPLPLVLVVAPNGAIMAGLTIKFDEYTLLNAFNGPGAEKALKALQDHKFVVLAIQNAKTTDNEPSLKAAREFKDDKQYAQTEIVQIDPTATAEAKFLGSLQIDRETKEAITVLLAPPGFRLGAFKGQTSKQALVDALKAASAPAGGCGPGGKCGPGGCK